jgi:large-conductance mechanosensitive channel
MGFTLLPYVAALGIIAACVALVIATMRNAKVYEESTARSAEINKQVIGLLIEIRDRLPKS